MSVYKAISKVAQEMAAVGISKNQKNQMQGYNFRGIDAVYNALAPCLVRHGLVILPKCVERTSVERTTAKGGLVIYTTVKCEFVFVCVEDGSSHTVTTYGEAMDSGDKSTNKAMSAAYKYAAFQTFCIPTEETAVDADEHTYRLQASNKKEPLSEERFAKAIEAIKAGKYDIAKMADFDLTDKQQSTLADIEASLGEAK